jgi:hypothetical protein
MKVCKKCVLPETYPGITFDRSGVCNFCLGYTAGTKEKPGRDFNNEEELSECLRKFKNPANKYDVLVPMSGGVDSCFTLIQMVEKFHLNPLVFHSDHGWDDKEASRNVEKLCKEVDVDLIIWKNELKFMRKLFKYFLESAEPVVSPCYACGNMLYLNGLEIAANFKIPLVVNGYSKGQAAMMHDIQKAVDWYGKMNDILLDRGDMEFFEQFNRKWQMLNHQVIYQGRADLEKEPEPGKILFIPLFVFRFYKTDKEKLQQICKDRFDWRPIPVSYPARTTNCEMIWLNSYRDLKIRGYTHYHDEYSTLIRAGEISRDQALADLELNPPPGLLERLAAEVNVDLEVIGKEVASPKKPAEARSRQSDNGDFGF